MNIDKIKTQFEKALELKSSDKYAALLKVELSNPTWRQDLDAIAERLKSIGSKADFKKRLEELVSLFDQVYEKITAPGLDAFIGWIQDHTKNSDENIKKLRVFLKENYESYSTPIESILASMENLPQEDEKHLFDPIVTDFNKKLKSEVSSFISSPDKFENNIEGFLSTLSSEYAGMSEIVELTFTSIDQLYTPEQKAIPSISFYEGIIQQAISRGQSLKEIDDYEKSKTLCERAKARIKSIKACISTLINTGVADCGDEDLKKLFLRYDKEMVISTGDISKSLSNYLTNSWEPLQNNYASIKNFYKESTLEFQTTEWLGIEKEAEITALYNEYNTVRKGNILPQIPTTKLEDVAHKLNACYDKIAKLSKKENETSKTIREWFQEFLNTYNNKKQLLDKLVEKHPPLKTSCDEIYAQGRTLTTLINGIEAISGDGTFLKALSDGTIYDMICDMNKTKEKFIEILKQSQMEAQIDWLNSLTSFEIDETNFKSDYLLELLKNGLITLSFKKEF